MMMMSCCCPLLGARCKVLAWRANCKGSMASVMAYAAGRCARRHGEQYRWNMVQELLGLKVLGPWGFSGVSEECGWNQVGGTALLRVLDGSNS